MNSCPPALVTRWATVCPAKLMLRVPEAAPVVGRRTAACARVAVSPVASATPTRFPSAARDLQGHKSRHASPSSAWIVPTVKAGENYSGPELNEPPVLNSFYLRCGRTVFPFRRNDSWQQRASAPLRIVPSRPPECGPGHSRGYRSRPPTRGLPSYHCPRRPPRRHVASALGVRRSFAPRQCI